MTDPKPPVDQMDAATPDDVATLYSWANLHGAKYRDFSASRAQAREESRLRVEAAEAAERLRLQEEAERKAQEEAQIAARIAAEAAEAARQAEAERIAEIARQAEAERQAVLAAQEAQRQAALQRSWQPTPLDPYQGVYETDFKVAPAPNASTAAQLPPSVPPLASGQELPPEPIQNAQNGPSHGQDQAQSRGFASSFAPAQFPSSGPVQYQSPTSSPVASQIPAPTELQDPYQVVNPLPDQRQSHAQTQFQSPVSAQNQGSPNSASFSAPPSSFPSSYQGSPGPTAPQYPTGTHSATFQAGYQADYLAEYPPGPHPTTHTEQYSGSPWSPPEYRESRELPTRPAWLAPELPEAPAMYPNSQYPASQAPQQPSQPAAQFAQPLPKASNSVAYQPRQQERVAPVLNYVTPSYTEPQNQQLTQNQTQNQPQSQAYAPNANRYPGPPSAFPPGSTAEEAPSTPRDQAANRWYALKSVFDPQPAPVEQVPVQPPARVPVLAVFSLAGGVGKTSLVASLGRALSSRGERVLLVDTAVYGLLPFFFGARDQRPGQLRTFNPPGASAEAPIQMVTLDPESPSAETQNPPINQDPNQRPNQNQFQAQNPAQNSAQNQEWLAQEIVRYSRGVNRILVDLPTASGATTRRVLSMGPTILVPVAPDMNSVVSVGAIESFFRHAGGNQNNHPGGKQILPYYILNQFDYSLPLHLDVREILREQIGDRLLPFALRRSPAVSEALAEGMTVMDYAPNATVAEDYMHLAEWVRSLSAPASQTYRGVRWSER